MTDPADLRPKPEPAPSEPTPSEPTPSEPAPAGTRLDWRTLVVHSITFKQARSALSAAAPLLAALGISRNLSLPMAILIIAAVTALSITLATLRWMRLHYQIVGGRLTVSQGVVGRRQRVVPIDRIRGVTMQTPALHRLFGLAVLSVDAAAGGQAKEEIKLDAIRRDEAERLRELLLTRAALATVPAASPEATSDSPDDTATPGAATPESEPPPPVPAERVYARLRPRWLLYSPLVGAYLVLPISAAGVVTQWLREAGVEWIDALVRWVKGSSGSGLWAVVLIVLAALVVVMLGALVAGAVSNWGFVLAARGNQLVSERGLVGHHVTSLEIARIRGYVLLEPIGLRLVRAGRLLALVTGVATQGRRGILLPIGPRSEAKRVAAEAVLVYSGTWDRHPQAALRRRIVRGVVPGLVFAGIAAVFDWADWLLWAALVLVVLGGLLGVDRYHALAHGYDGRAVAVRSGSLFRRTAVLQRRSLTGWRVRQSVFQRRAGLITVTALVGAGNGGYSATDCAETDGRAWLCRVSPQWTDPLSPERPEAHVGA